MCFDRWYTELLVECAQHERGFRCGFPFPLILSLSTKSDNYNSGLTQNGCTLLYHPRIRALITTSDRREHRTPFNTFATADALFIINHRCGKTRLRNGSNRAYADRGAGVILRAEFFTDNDHTGSFAVKTDLLIDKPYCIGIVVLSQLPSNGALQQRFFISVFSQENAENRLW